MNCLSGEPSLEMYLKLAESFMKKGNFEAALYNIGEAAEFNPESPVSSFSEFYTTKQMYFIL